MPNPFLSDDPAERRRAVRRTQRLYTADRWLTLAPVIVVVVLGAACVSGYLLIR